MVFTRLYQSLTSSKKSFYFWFGYGSPIFLLLTLCVSFFYSESIVFWGYCILSQIWWWETLLTTCSRCQHYGTTNCGIQGKMVSKLLPFKSSVLSWNRIQLHRVIDILYIVISVIICWKWQITGIIATVWGVGAFIISIFPKRFHGLQHKLK